LGESQGAKDTEIKKLGLGLWGSVSVRGGVQIGCTWGDNDVTLSTSVTVNAFAMLEVHELAVLRRKPTRACLLLWRIICTSRNKRFANL